MAMRRDAFLILALACTWHRDLVQSSATVDATVAERTYRVEPSQCPRTGGMAQELHDSYGKGDEMRHALQPELLAGGGGGRPLIVLLAFPKTGIVWVEQVLTWNRSADGLRVEWADQPHREKQLAGLHARGDLDVLALRNPTPRDLVALAAGLRARPFRAVLMARDPRDCAVSGWFYQQWSADSWLQIASQYWASASSPATTGWGSGDDDALALQQARRGSGDGAAPLTLQQAVRALPLAEGLLLELDTFREGVDRLCALAALGHPDVLLLRYEDMWADPAGGFRRAANWLYSGWERGGGGAEAHARADALFSNAMAYTDFHNARVGAAASAAAADTSGDYANRYDYSNSYGGGSGPAAAAAGVSSSRRRLSKGPPGGLRQHLAPEHRAVFGDAFGGLLAALGYEAPGGRWTAAGPGSEPS